jgi:hypothetical protein
MLAARSWLSVARWDQPPYDVVIHVVEGHRLLVCELEYHERTIMGFLNLRDIHCFTVSIPLGINSNLKA